MELKKTPIYDVHVKLGGNMIEYAGWALPSEFTSLTEEHNAVRKCWYFWRFSYGWNFYYRKRCSKIY